MAIPVKKTFTYREADPVKQAEFRQVIEKYDPKKVVYLDETGFDQQPYAYGWSRKGIPVTGKRTGKRVERASVVAALIAGVLCAGHIFRGTCNRQVFFSWLKNVLLPMLSPGFTLVMDNARFHHATEIVQLVEQHGCQILYLPPYSPELNPIEQAWAPLKNRVRKNLRDGVDDLHQAIINSLT